MTAVEDYDQFWAKVDVSGDCWEWTGAINSDGYGSAWFGGRALGAHRVAFTLMCGPIHDGLTLDHLCRNRSCVNPDHLEPVTNRTNVLRGVGAAARGARQTHCIQGHPFTGDNLRITPKGWRKCLTCQRERQPEYQRRYRQRCRERSAAI